MTRLKHVGALLLCALVLTTVAEAQTAPVRTSSSPQTEAKKDDARLIVTVSDQTSAVLPGATVTVTGLEDATKTAAPIVAHTADRGVATLDGLAPGKYSVRVEMDGFDPTVMPDLKITKGENKRTITMALKSVTETVTVQVDKQAAAVDRNMTFGSALTREQIDALPDDPAELEKALKDMAGPDAIIRVDSFEGGDSQTSRRSRPSTFRATSLRRRTTPPAASRLTSSRRLARGRFA